MSTAISIEHISKTYRLGTISAGTLQDDLRRWWAGARGRPDPTLRVGTDERRAQTGGLFRALDDISFTVPEGEVLGIIGHNGAGKSTLLKVLSRVTTPSTGRITIRGRVASLLEVGTGFHPDLTGRENVYLNGAILGMTKAEIRTNFDAIVAFAECETFIDTPVKRYSSGMYVRLAFAVAAHLEPEILIVDEVLAVGDLRFQRKCLGKMRDVATHGRTILFVSHSMSAIAALCGRALLMRAGRVAMHDVTSRVVAEYQSDRMSGQNAAGSIAEMPRSGTGKGRFVRLEIQAVDEHQRALPTAVPGCDLLIETDVHGVADFADANVAVVILDATGYRVVDVNTALRGDALSLTRGQRATVTFHVRDVLLKAGTYYVSLWLGRGGIESIDSIESAAVWDMQEDATSRHTEVFPGVYQCRFTHTMVVHQGDHDRESQGVDEACPPAGVPQRR
jgi:lipopolysaccharide transport system ATP-binding protein